MLLLFDTCLLPTQVRSEWSTLPPDHEGSLPAQLDAAIILIEQGQPQAAMNRVLLEMIDDEDTALAVVRMSPGCALF